MSKVFYHQEMVEEWSRTGDTRGPVHMQLSLLNGCNHRCPWCSIARLQKHHQPTLIDADRLISFLQSMVPHGLKACTLVGNGEPLMHPRAEEITRRLLNSGIEVGVFTNASFLVGGVADALMDATFVRMTLNAATQDMHALTHGVEGEFARCVNNARAFSLSRSYKRPTLGVQCATHQVNLHQLPELTRLVRDYIRADYFSIKPVINRGPFHGRRPMKGIPQRERNSVDLAEAAEIFKTCEALATPTFKVYAKSEQFGDAVPYDYNDGRDYKACIALPFEAYIHENGNFDICGPIKLGGTSRGPGNDQGVEAFNIYRSTFEEIWRSPERQELMRSIDLHKCPAACRPHPLNKILWDLRKNGPPAWSGEEPVADTHVNFL